MSGMNIQTVTITVDVDDLRHNLMFGLNTMYDQINLQRLYGSVLNIDGIAGITRIHEIFFPGEDASLVAKKPELTISRARSIMIDAWAGMNPNREPPLDKLLEVEKLIYIFKGENWFEYKRGGKGFDFD